MGCCSVSNTTTPPFKYSPNQVPLPKEKLQPQRYFKLESPKEQGFIYSISCANAPPNQFACSWGKNMFIYDLKTQKIFRQFQPHSQNVTKCRFLQGGNNLITSSVDRTLKLWDLDNLTAPKKVFEGHQMVVPTFCVSLDQTKLCSGSRDQSIFLWDIQTGQKISEHLIMRNMLTCMEWIPMSESNFVQCSEDLTIRIWDTRELKPVTKIELNDNYFAYCCDVDSTGTKLLTGHYACNDQGSGVLLWDLRKATEGSYIWRFLEHKEAVVQTAFMKHSKTEQEVAISASRDSKLKIIKLADGVELSSYQDTARWPFSTFGVMNRTDGKPAVVAGLCKCSASKITALDLEDDYGVTLFATSETDSNAGAA